MERKKFKYFAIRVANSVVFRRTVSTVQRVRSVLYNPLTGFKLEQVNYVGGTPIGCMPYVDWKKYSKITLNINQGKQIDKSLYRSLDPYICKETQTCLFMGATHNDRTREAGQDYWNVRSSIR